MSLMLYYHPLSSFCWKALIALYENDTPFTPQLVDLSNETERAARGIRCGDARPHSCARRIDGTLLTQVAPALLPLNLLSSPRHWVRVRGRVFSVADEVIKSASRCYDT